MTGNPYSIKQKILEKVIFLKKFSINDLTWEKEDAKHLIMSLMFDDILTDPNSHIIKNFKDQDLKIYSQDGWGAYFRGDGSLRGFIEKQYE